MEQETEQNQRKDRQKEEMMDILDEYFNRGVDRGKFIDTSRIPLICQDISTIHRDIADIKGNIGWVIKIIIGSVILALLGLIFVHAPVAVP